MMGKLITNAIELAQNPYGNYAIQQAFEHWDREICMDLIPCFFGKVYQLSMQKCSSNVIDRCIQNSSKEYLATLMQELISCDRLSSKIETLTLRSDNELVWELRGAKRIEIRFPGRPSEVG